MLSFIFSLRSTGMAEFSGWQVLFFLLIETRSDLLVRIWWIFVSLNLREFLCVSFFRTGSGLCIYHLLVWSNFNLLHNSQWLSFPTQSCLVLYSFYDSLLHLLIMWLLTLAILLCTINFCFNIIWPYGFICAGIKRDSVSFLRFPFLNQVQKFSWAISQFITGSIYTIVFFHFCFIVFVVFLSVLTLQLLLLISVISLHLLFLEYSSIPWIVTSM